MGRITASRKSLTGDPKYGSLLASKFINCMMWNSKKSNARRVFYSDLDIIQEKLKDAPPIEVFTQAVENVKPNIEVRSKRVGGASYQVPMQVNRAASNRWPSAGSCPAARKRGGPCTRSWPASSSRHTTAKLPPHQGQERPPHGRRQQGLRPLRLVRLC